MSVLSGIDNTNLSTILWGTNKTVREVWLYNTRLWSSGASTFTVTANFNTLSNSGGLGASVSFSYGVSDFALTSQPSWVSSVTQTTSGGKTTGFTFDYDPNAGTSTRTGSITFFAAGASRSVSLTQAGTAVVSVTGVTLNTWSLNLTVGQTQTLTATVSPSNATNKSVTWSSSNTSVATVSQSGVVTAVSNGSARITVTTQDGNYIDYCDATIAALYLTVDTGLIEFDQDAYGSQSREAIVISSNQSWSAVASSGFAIDGSASGTNNGTIYVYPQSYNSSVNAKTGTVTITPNSGSAVTVQLSQAGLSVVSLSETQLNVSASSGNYSLTVYDSDNVGWLIESNQTWCTVSPSNGYGDTTLTVSVGQYTGTSSNRTATITLTPASGPAVTCTVMQAAAQAITFNPTSVSFDGAGSEEVISINGTFSWWEITSAPTWCTYTMSSGEPNNPIVIEAAANTGSSTREGTLVVEVDGVAYQIPLSQASESAVNYTFSISATPSDATVTINGTQRTSYACPSGTSITWSVAKSGYITQSGTYTMTAANHTETVTLVAATLSVSLSGGSGSSSITIPTFAYDADSYSEGASFYINANQPWTLTKPSWCTIYGDTTSGSGTAILRVYPSSANSGSSARTGTITVTGTYGGSATINLTQNYNTTALQSIAIDGPDTLDINDASAYMEVYTPSNTTQTGVTWSITSGSSYCTGTVEDVGGGGDSYVLYPTSSAYVGASITIRCQSTVNSSIYATKTITIVDELGPVAVPESITVSGATTVYDTSNQAQYTATVSPAAAEQGVTWSLLYAGTRASIDQNGLLTVNSNATTATQIRVVATSTEDSSVSGYLDVYIRYRS